MKKQTQLGMNPGTASHRLVKDILYSLVVKTEQNACFHCGEQMTRETFSVEHKEPWLDSEDPVKMFFDLDNISFSHMRCNTAAARRVEPAHGGIVRYKQGCRCDLCLAGRTEYYKRNEKPYCPERRRRKYDSRLERLGHP